jgi:hypothetical protein
MMIYNIHVLTKEDIYFEIIAPLLVNVYFIISQTCIG